VLLCTGSGDALWSHPSHHFFVSLIQELEGDEEGEDEDDADVNPKVSNLGTS
jgi:hypothetical protein